MKIGLGEQQKISKRVLDLIDFIELKNINRENLEYFKQFGKQILLHVQNVFERKFLFTADDDFSQVISSPKTKKLIKSLNPSSFSFHLGLATTKYKIINYDMVACSPILTEEEILQKIKNNILKVKKFFPTVAIYLENNPYLPDSISKGAFRHICQPEFIKKIIAETHSFFLLDFGHAITSSYNLGFKSPKDYFAQLPLEKTKQVHIHRAKNFGDFWNDAHLPITKEEVNLLDFVLERTKDLEYITLEAQGQHDDRTIVKELTILRKYT